MNEFVVFAVMLWKMKHMYFQAAHFIIILEEVYLLLRKVSQLILLILIMKIQ